MSNHNVEALVGDDIFVGTNGQHTITVPVQENRVHFKCCHVHLEK